MHQAGDSRLTHDPKRKGSTLALTVQLNEAQWRMELQLEQAGAAGVWKAEDCWRNTQAPSRKFGLIDQ